MAAGKPCRCCPGGSALHERLGIVKPCNNFTMIIFLSKHDWDSYQSGAGAGAKGGVWCEGWARCAACAGSAGWRGARGAGPGKLQRGLVLQTSLGGSSIRRFAPCCLSGRAASEAKQKERCCLPTFKFLRFPCSKILTREPAETKRDLCHLAGGVAALSKPLTKTPLQAGKAWLRGPDWGNESPPLGAPSSKAFQRLLPAE